MFFRLKSKEKEMLERALDEMKLLRGEIVNIKGELNRLRPSDSFILLGEKELVELSAGAIAEGIYLQGTETAKAAEIGTEPDENVQWPDRVTPEVCCLCGGEKQIFENDYGLKDYSGTDKASAGEDGFLIDFTIDNYIVGDCATDKYAHAERSSCSIVNINQDAVIIQMSDKIDVEANNEAGEDVVDKETETPITYTTRDFPGAKWSVVKAPGRKSAWWKFWVKDYGPGRSV